MKSDIEKYNEIVKFIKDNMGTEDKFEKYYEEISYMDKNYDGFNKGQNRGKYKALQEIKNIIDGREKYTVNNGKLEIWKPAQLAKVGDIKHARFESNFSDNYLHMDIQFTNIEEVQIPNVVYYVYTYIVLDKDKKLIGEEKEFRGNKCYWNHVVE